MPPVASLDSAAPTPPTEAAPAPSILHARIEELLGKLIDRYVPASYLTLIGRAAPMLNGLRSVLGKGFALPALPTNLPSTPAELKALVRRELWQRPIAELAHVITLAHFTTGAWLSELKDSLTPPIVDDDPETEPEPVPEPAEDDTPANDDDEAIPTDEHSVSDAPPVA